MSPRALFAATAAFALAACATPAETAANSPADGRDCFNASSVTGFEYIDQHHVKVRVSASRYYILTTDWNARDLNWAHSIALRSNTSWICTGNGLGVDVIGGDFRRSYPISDVSRAPDPPPQEQQQGS